MRRMSGGSAGRPATRPAQPGAGLRRMPPKPPRRRPRARWLAGAARAAMAVLCLGLVGGGGAWLWRSGWAERQLAAAEHAALAATAAAGLRLEEVLLTGRRETAREDLLALLRLERGQPTLGIDPAALRTALEDLPWVRTAAVERRLPGTLFIEILEHEPLALWQRAGRLVLIGRTGAVIPEPRLGRFADLPVVVGDEAPAHAAALLDMLAVEPALARRVTAAVLVGGRRWNLRLDDRIDIRLPEEDGAAAWRELARLEREHRLLAHDLLAVDLRLPDRLIVRLTPEAAARRRSPSDST